MPAPSPPAGSAPATRARIDGEGYLSLTGRLKELINRGGEKISPIEVDTVLMDHPAVGQCVTFAMPHDVLGEEVAAAIVLREGQQATEQDIRSFAAEHLAAFKVPRKILFLERNPQGRHRQAAAHRPGPEARAGGLSVSVPAPSICVFGAGAIGGLLAARLEAVGMPVSIVARGPHREAVEAGGLRLRSGEAVSVARPRVVSDPARWGRRITCSSR